MNDTTNRQLTVADNMVVTMEYTLSVDGEIVEKTTPENPVQFIQGIGQLIPGLERELNGMHSGETKNVLVAPQDGYGEYDEEDDAFAEIPADQFPAEIPLVPGIEVLLHDEEGEEQEAYISKVKDDMVILSLNHPLAGKELDFSVKIIDLRPATEEELLHEHVHAHSE